MSFLWYTYLRLLWLCFRWPSVILIDFDGEIDARLACGPKKFRYATRFGWCGEKVLLLPGGAVKGPCFVDRWEPLFPPHESQPT